LITLLDENRQWFKSSLGIDFTETPETFVLPTYIMSEEVYEVNNALENEVLLIILGDRMSGDSVLCWCCNSG
jgi:hypothetical protein